MARSLSPSPRSSTSPSGSCSLSVPPVAYNRRHRRAAAARRLRPHRPARAREVARAGVGLREGVDEDRGVRRRCAPSARARGRRRTPPAADGPTRWQHSPGSSPPACSTALRGRPARRRRARARRPAARRASAPRARGAARGVYLEGAQRAVAAPQAPRRRLASPTPYASAVPSAVPRSARPSPGSPWRCRSPRRIPLGSVSLDLASRRTLSRKSQMQAVPGAWMLSSRPGWWQRPGAAPATRQVAGAAFARLQRSITSPLRAPTATVCWSASTAG